MTLASCADILQLLSQQVDASLAARLIDEFVSLERRYVLRDWEPAELDGGQFSEVLARIVYHKDSGNLNLSKSFDQCIQYVENQQVPHLITPRQDALMLCRVLQTVYSFRSKRGAIHVSPYYSANQMDSRLMIEGVRWCMNESLRIFGSNDAELVAKMIREILQFDVPCVGNFDSILLVQRTDLNPEEEVLILLHYAGEQGFARKTLANNCKFSQSTLSRTLQKLTSSQCRQVVMLQNSNYRLTDLGSKRVRETLSHKLTL